MEIPQLGQMIPKLDQLDISLVESILKEYLQLEEEVKLKKKRLDEIKNWCKCVGSFNTYNYACLIKEQSRTGIVGLERVIAAIGRDILEENNLISVSYFEQVHIVAIKL